MTPALLEAQGLEVIRGGRPILEVETLAIREGEVLSLIGPNGAGKTTLLHALATLLRPEKGAMWFRGEPAGNHAAVTAFRRRIAMVFQEPLLFDTTVAGNIASGLRIRGMARADRRAVVAREARRFGIDRLLDRSARTLSGGEAQRTSLARAFAVAPEILFLDEPFASLDPPTREALLDDLERVLRDTGTTAVMATHDQMEALRLSHRIAVMNQGRIVQIGLPAEIMNRPADPFVANFVGIETVLPGRVSHREEGACFVAVDGREIQVAGDFAPGEAVTLCIRPENVALSLGGPSPLSSVRNAFPATIQRVLPGAGFSRVRLDCGFPLTAFVTGHALRELGLAEGVAVTASFKATAVHVLRRRAHGDA